MGNNSLQDAIYIYLETEAECFTDFDVSISDPSSITRLPKIIKGSYKLLERNLKDPEFRGLLVLPERKYSAILFALVKTVDDFRSGRIERVYNITNFQIGQKLKLDKLIVEFLGVEKNPDGSEKLKLKFADATYLCPINYAPILQLVKTQRNLSKSTQFSKIKSQIARVVDLSNQSMPLNETFKEYSTHTKGTIVFFTQTGIFKEIINKTFINNEKVVELLLIGQIVEGSQRLIGSSTSQGNPLLTVSSDLEHIFTYCSASANVKALIIDISNAAILTNQLSIIDDLLSLKVPVLFITNTENSFELDALELRKVNIFRWNRETLTGQIIDNKASIVDKKIANLVNFNLSKEVFDDMRFFESYRILKRYYEDKENLDYNVNCIIEILFPKLLYLSRSIIEMSQIDKDSFISSLDECKVTLMRNKRYLSDDTYNDLGNVIELLVEISVSFFESQKIAKIEEIIRSRKYRSICVLVDDNVSIDEMNRYWLNNRNITDTRVKVEFERVSSYIKKVSSDFDLVIISSWFRSSIMKVLLFNHSSASFALLLFSYESNWAEYYLSKWDSKTKVRKDNDFLSSIIQQDIKIEDQHLSTHVDAEVTDETDHDIERTIREFKYKVYAKLPASSQNEETIDAIPVELCQNHLMFFKPSNEVITVTEIFLGESEEIETKKANELFVDDFIIIRESQKSIIRDIADKILDRSGLYEARKTSSIWKETLNIMNLTDSINDIRERLAKEGCNRSIVTVREWITNDERIMPNSKDDLYAIAAVSEDNILREKIDEVFIAGKTVRNAHMSAGVELSKSLKKSLASELGDQYDINPYDFPNPYALDIEGIGTVKIFKVTDIGPIIKIGSSQIHKIIERKT